MVGELYKGLFGLWCASGKEVCPFHPSVSTINVDLVNSHGCNHMTCNRCSSHFCYRCGESISPQDPYAHYRRPGHACFEKLFDQEEIARFERETAMGLVGLPGGAVEEDAAEWRDIRGFWEW
jgi:E3 ubiquitin-protein ligase RNF14